MRLASWLLMTCLDLFVRCAEINQRTLDLINRIHVHMIDRKPDKHESIAAMLGQRSKGAITGSRDAGQLGRIPVQATLLDLHDKLYKLSWKGDDVALGAASFVDNLYFAGGLPHGAS